MIHNQFIQKLTIKNFKTIRNLQDFKLRNINILIGVNGSGKSNFLSFFSLVRNLFEKQLVIYVAKKGNADGILTFGRKGSDYLEVEIESCLDGVTNEYGFKLMPTEDNKFFIVDEKFSETGVSLFATDGIFYESKVDDMEIPENDNGSIRLLKQTIAKFKGIRQYHFHDTGDSSPIKSDDYVFDNEKLKFDGKNIAAFIRRLYFEYPDSYNIIVNTIRLAIPDFYNFYIREDVKSNEQTALYWINKNDPDSMLHPMFLSDGSLRFICLVTVLLQPTELMPEVIIIDEPELGLHPQALTIIANLIDRISLQKQFIIATQSSGFVDLFMPEDIIVVDKNTDGTSKFTRLNKDEWAMWLEEYNLSELWNMNIIGGRP